MVKTVRPPLKYRDPPLEMFMAPSLTWQKLKGSAWRDWKEGYESPELLENQPSNFQVDDRQVNEIVGQQWYQKCIDWILRSREQLDENFGENSISPAQQVTGPDCHGFEEKFVGSSIEAAQ